MGEPICLPSTRPAIDSALVARLRMVRDAARPPPPPAGGGRRHRLAAVGAVDRRAPRPDHAGRARGGRADPAAVDDQDRRRGSRSTGSSSARPTPTTAGSPASGSATRATPYLARSRTRRNAYLAERLPAAPRRRRSSGPCSSSEAPPLCSSGPSERAADERASPARRSPRCGPATTASSSSGCSSRRPARGCRASPRAGSSCELTGSGTAVGLVTAAQFVPMLLGGVFGGVIADRFDKRRILFVSQSILGVRRRRCWRSSPSPAS